MDYKEKLEKAMELYPTANADQRYVLECLFPELEESEDEKVRKEMLSVIRQFSEDSSLCGKKYDYRKWIAWLEKQGEQKSTDKIEPKFKVGDWVVTSYGKVNQVIAVDKDGDGFTLDDDTYFSGSWIDGYHLWTIKDAKDGDVLAEDSCIFIIQKLGDNSTAAKTYCTLYDDGDFDDGSILYFDIDSTKPATKEQSDLLFQKLNNEGYEWDADKKELKKPQRMVSAEAKEALYDKPAWSEDDENVLEDIKEAIINYWHGDTQDILLDWLKSIKQRIKGE